MSKIDLKYTFSCVVVVLCFIYQQREIYNLHAKLETVSSSSKIEHTLTTTRYESNDYKKSPPPIVPKIVVDKNDFRGIDNNKNAGAKYGGAGDEVHLGGFTVRDNATINYDYWHYMLGPMAIKSIIDIGCGRGISSKYFKDNGAKILCVEGSHDAIKNTFLERSDIVQHDFSKGAWWPEDTYDLAYSTEFLEHVGRQYMPNYFPIMKQAAIVIVSASMWGGYHHVEVHDRSWWIARFTAQGFVYSRDYTKILKDQITSFKLDGGQTLWMGAMVFINPSVASLPKHQHLFGGNGCYPERRGALGNEDNGIPCVNEDALPREFQSLLDCKMPRDKAGKLTKKFQCVRNYNATIM